jgi:hypothetical protein
MRSIRLLLFPALLLIACVAFAKGSGSPRATRCATCARSNNGKIARSSTEKHQFERSHPCPATGRSSGACPGYVVDHVKPLKRGGADDLGNMQWQTKAEAKVKDKAE